MPDIITVAKGINSGYVPLGAMIARGEIVDRVRDRFFPGGLTYAGHPLACASAIASIEAFQEEGVVENAAAMGEWFGEALRGLAERHPSVGDVRGLGCFWGLELVKNRETKEMLVPFNASGEAAAPVARLAKAALERGLYLMTHWNVVMVVPPLTITRAEAEEGVAILDDVLSLADEYVAGASLRAERRRADRDRRRLVERVPEDGVARPGRSRPRAGRRARRGAPRQWSYGRYESAPRTTSVGTRTRRTGAVRRDLPVRGDDRRLGVAVAPARRRPRRGGRGAPSSTSARGASCSWLS